MARGPYCICDRHGHVLLREPPVRQGAQVVRAWDTERCDAMLRFEDQASAAAYLSAAFPPETIRLLGVHVDRI